MILLTDTLGLHGRPPLLVAAAREGDLVLLGDDGGQIQCGRVKDVADGADVADLGAELAGSRRVVDVVLLVLVRADEPGRGRTVPVVPAHQGVGREPRRARADGSWEKK